jgi:hypothetical protein
MLLLLLLSPAAAPAAATQTMRLCGYSGYNMILMTLHLGVLVG